MLVLCLVLTVASTFTHFDLLHLLASASEVAHNGCIQLPPPSPRWGDLYQALLCAKRLNDAPYVPIFKQTGLYHLLIVSGVHLCLLELFLRRAENWGRYPRSLTLFALFAFALACQLQPPVTRAWTSFVFRELNKKFKWNWRADHIVLISGCTCLALCPSWIESYSLQLSWSAALALSNSKASSLMRSTCVYLALLPFFVQWQATHPLTIIVNVALAPILSAGLFPLSLLTAVGAFPMAWTDQLWGWAIELLDTSRVLLPTWSLDVSWPQWSHWAAITGAHVGLHLYRTRAKQKLCFIDPFSS